MAGTTGDFTAFCSGPLSRISSQGLYRRLGSRTQPRMGSHKRPYSIRGGRPVSHQCRKRLDAAAGSAHHRRMIPPRPTLVARDACLLVCCAVLGLQLPISCLAQSQIGTPAKIEIVTESPTVSAGAKAQLRVNLLNPENQPAAANKDLAIQVESRSPSGNTETSTVIVKAGQNSGTIEIPAKEAGLIKLIASNRQLASGGSVLNVRQSGQDMATPTPEPL